MKTLGARLTYANVISTICLFLVLGGGAAFAAGKLARNSVGTPQLKKDAVTGAKVKNGSLRAADLDLKGLPTVPSATNAVSANSANTAASATTAGTAASAANATTATTAITANSLAPLEARHVVGAAGEPAFRGGSSTAVPPIGAAPDVPVSFYKDHEGIVHLEGFAKTGKGKEPFPGVIFVLPVGMRPPPGQTVFFAPETYVFGSDTSFQGKDLSGVVISREDEEVSLNGITFRAGG